MTLGDLLLGAATAGLFVVGVRGIARLRVVPRPQGESAARAVVHTVQLGLAVLFLLAMVT